MTTIVTNDTIVVADGKSIVFKVTLADLLPQFSTDLYPIQNRSGLTFYSASYDYSMLIVQMINLSQNSNMTLSVFKVTNNYKDFASVGSSGSNTTSYATYKEGDTKVLYTIR